jgi:hypothetical protein
MSEILSAASNTTRDGAPLAGAPSGFQIPSAPYPLRWHSHYRCRSADRRAGMVERSEQRVATPRHRLHTGVAIRSLLQPTR